MITPIISKIPAELSDRLVTEYVGIKKRYSLADWGVGQLQGGRFAEVVVRIFQHLLNEPVTPYGSDIPGNEKTRILNKLNNDGSIDEHVRQKVVPLTRLLLDFRNNRDAAHLGGFDANHQDSLFVMTTATWIMCELVRVYSGCVMDVAQKIVEELTDKELPVIFEFQGELFITRDDLSPEDETMVVLYKVDVADYKYLFSKTKYQNSSRFKDKLKKMLAAKLIGFKDNQYFLLPKGKKYVENNGLLHFS